jgi:hypothetical protein
LSGYEGREEGRKGGRMGGWEDGWEAEGWNGGMEGGTERWRDGGMEGWMEGRRDGGDGGMEGWKDGGMEGWRNGGMKGWRNGGTEGCKDGGTEGWRDGRMEEIGTEGQRKKKNSNPFRSAILSSYNSHYALVDSDGDIPKSSDQQLFDELVIPQESQVTPAYVLRLDSEKMGPIMKQWKERKGRRRSFTAARDMEVEGRSNEISLGF